MYREVIDLVFSISAIFLSCQMCAFDQMYIKSWFWNWNLDKMFKIVLVYDILIILSNTNTVHKYDALL